MFFELEIREAYFIIFKQVSLDFLMYDDIDPVVSQQNKISMLSNTDEVPWSQSNLCGVVCQAA